jgi:LysM repeat protein
MSVPVGTDAPPPTPSPESERSRAGASGPSPVSAREAAVAICPYLVSESGAFRSVVPTRDHRCSAVEPASSQTTEKQRRHCLAAEHVDCSLYRAARAARATSLASGGLNPDVIDRLDRRRRAVARTAPVVLEPPRLVDQVTRLQFDRAPGQIALIGLMLVAFAVVAIARFSAGSAVPDSPPGPSQVAAASSTPRPTPATTPPPSVAPSGDPSIAPSPGPSFSTTYTVKKGDTLSVVAARFKTTVAKIVAANGLTTKTLKIGQVLKIP